MSDNDLHFVELLISPMNKLDQEVARRWIPLFWLPHEAKRLYEASGRTDPELERRAGSAMGIAR
jgi:hypothetical protein